MRTASSHFILARLVKHARNCVTLQVKALGLAEHGRDILAEKCSDEYSKFVCLAVDGWDAAADRDLIRAVNAC